MGGRTLFLHQGRQTEYLAQNIIHRKSVTYFEKVLGRRPDAVLKQLDPNTVEAQIDVGNFVDDVRKCSVRGFRKNHTADILIAGMMTFGGLLSVLAAWRYHVVNRDIERGKVRADRGLVILVTIMMALLSGAMIAFALLTAG